MGNFTSTLTNIPPYWPKLEFSLFLFGEILSIPCYLFVFYHILFDKTSRTSLHNHVIILLLFYNFLGVTIDLSLTLDYARLGYVSLFFPSLCLIWQFVDNGIWYGGISLMLWASFERHILIFHSNLIRTTRARLFLHYIPLTFFTLYTPLLYFYLIFIYPCNLIAVRTTIRCGRVCYRNTIPMWFNFYDSFVNYSIPILLIVLFSSSFVFRFVQQKQRLKRIITWRQCRKMTIQLGLLSSIYLLFDLPYVIIFIVQTAGYPSFASNIISPYISRLTFVPAIVLPYAILCAIPRLKQKLQNLFFCK
uniref:Neuromedin U receptor 2-like protein n=1 Tax=Adineta vaga TaxID=104782 RepID=B3G477_ADIVA|nr:neuromedin U receptor 2-like protein [Adineta vaga]